MPACIRIVRVQLQTLEPRRLLSIGDIDTSFGDAGVVNLVANFVNGPPLILPAGQDRIYVFGTDRVQRRSADGSLDNSFNGNGVVLYGFDQVRDAEIMTDGKIVIAGYDTTGGSSAPYISQFLRLNADGSRDNTFGANGIINVNALFNFETEPFVSEFAAQDDGKLIVHDGFTNIYRITPAGVLDSTFAQFDYDWVYGNGSAASVAVVDGGKILVGGYDLKYATTPFNFVRLTRDGAVDTTFGVNGYLSGVSAESFTVVADDSIYTIWDSQDWRHLSVRRISPDGVVDASFQPEVNVNAAAGEGRVVLQPDGKIILADMYSLSRFNTDGTLDSTFPVLQTLYKSPHEWTFGFLSVHGAVVSSSGDLLLGVTDSGNSGAKLYRLHGTDTGVPDGPLQVANGTITFIGSTADDGISISGHSNSVTVQHRYGFGQTYTNRNVTAIQIETRGGRDVIELEVAIPSTVTAGDGDDIIWGGYQADSITAGDGNDRIWGLGGADLLEGGGGRDRILGGEGNDTIRGGANADRLCGEYDDDQIWADGGNDVIAGGERMDALYGGAGVDTFVTTEGTEPDWMTGGRGWDLALCKEADDYYSIEQLLAP